MHPSARWLIATAVLLVLPLSVAACGSKGEDKASTLSITTSDVGKNHFKTEAPKSIKGGVVKMKFRNTGKAPHEAQLLRLDGGHGLAEALKIAGQDKPVIPRWLHTAGGVAAIAPGATGTATLELPAGKYAVIDTQSDNGPPPAVRGAKATFDVTGDNGGKLEATDTNVEVKDKGKDKFEFVPSNLKTGANELTFDNKSKELHHVVAAPLKPGVTVADVKKGLLAQKGPPPFDQKAISSTAVLDGKTEEKATLKLRKGRNVLVCFLTDRDGKGKPHFAEGLLKEVDVK